MNKPFLNKLILNMYLSKNPKISLHTKNQIWLKYSSGIVKRKKLTQNKLAFNMVFLGKQFLK